MIPAPLPNDRSLRLLIDRARERLRANLGDKLTGAVVALVLEALLLLVLLSIGEMRQPHKDVPMVSVAFDAREYSDSPHQPEPKPATKSARATPPPPQAQALPQVAQVAPVQPPAAIIPVSPQQMKSFDISFVDPTIGLYALGVMDAPIHLVLACRMTSHAFNFALHP